MSTQTDSFKKKDGRSQCLSVVAGISVLAVIGMAIALVLVVIDKKTGEEKVPDVCLTPGCAKAASRVLAAVDPSIEPCDNFYEFACGRWMKTHLIPEDSSSIDIFNVIRNNVAITNKYLLEDPVVRPNGSAIRKAKDLYASCVNTDIIEKKDISVVIPLLMELGGWPLLGNKPGGMWNSSEFNLAKLMATLRKYNNKVGIDMAVGIDDKNSTNYIITFDAQDFGMPSSGYLLDPRQEIEAMREAYIQMAKGIAVLMGADPATAEDDVRAAVKLEIDLANITMSDSDRREPGATYNKMTVADLARRFPEPAPSEAIQFNWHGFIQMVFDLGTDKPIINSTEPVLVRDMAYYQRFFGVLQKHGKRTVANYMVWRIMQHRAGNLPQKFADVIEEYNKVVYGVTAAGARWKSCLSYTVLQLGLAVGNLFIKEAFDDTAMNTALEMIGGLRVAFDEILQEEPWMDDQTRRAARDKAEAMNAWIGYPDGVQNETLLDDIYRDVAVDRESYFQNVLGNLQRWGLGDLGVLGQTFSKNSWSEPPSTVNAQYSFILNTIQFPAGIFQPPFYEKDQPRSMNYGGIGVIIGHEITHGFDDQGSRYDKVGNLHNWWDTSILQNFMEKATCIVNQYGSFEVPELGPGETMNGRTTLGENIADNGGLKESFRAYRNFIKTLGHEEPLLPGVKYSNNELFFINFAQNWCNKETFQSYVNSIKTDPHSPGKFRVIGTLQNSEDFARTFSCKSGSFMNPVKKCSVWKK